jgi:hypothetical protein
MKELFNKAIHNLQIYNMKIIVYVVHNIYNSHLLLSTNKFFYFTEECFMNNETHLSQCELQ